MRRRSSLLVATLLATACAPRSALAQQPAPGHPTTIQLPTLSSFSVDTSVSVPDSGAGYTEAAREARARGAHGLRPAGANLAAQGRGGEGGATRTNAANRLNLATDAFARALTAARQSSAGRPAPSVAQARAMWITEQRSRASAGQKLMAQGEQAAASGRQGTAKIYYDRAARADQRLKKEAADKLRSLELSTPK